LIIQAIAILRPFRMHLLWALCRIASIYGTGQPVIGDARGSRENRGVGKCSESDVTGSTCVRSWGLLPSPETDTGASQRRATCVSKDIQQSDRALRRYVRPTKSGVSRNRNAKFLYLYSPHPSHTVSPGYSDTTAVPPAVVEMSPKGSCY